jgi:hypothetical protein
MTFNAEDGALSSQSLAASGSVTFDVDASAKIEMQVQIRSVGGGTVATTNGCRVRAFRRLGTGPRNDTEPVVDFTILNAVSTTKDKSFALPTGKWRVQLNNLDTTNAITVAATTATIDGMT